MTYARARLWLGISGVGSLVVLSLLAWGYQLGWVFFPFDGSRFGDAAALWAFYIFYATISFYFDFMGGYWLPCKFERLCLIFPVFLMKWARGIAVQGTIMVASGLIVLEAGKAAGFWAAFSAFALLQLLLLAFQARLAVMAGGLGTAEGPIQGYEDVFGESKPPAILLRALDPGFSGGWTGLPGLERLVLPDLWNRSLPAEAIQAELMRRKGLLQTGSRTRGVLLALAWNLLGFAVAAQAPGAGVTRVSELVQTILGFSLWSFFGLLILPSLSRGGVFEADRWAHQNGVGFSSLYTLIRELDQLQDDEPVRRKWVERIFHPVPSVENRLELLAQQRQSFGAWHAARTALYLSWAGFGLLSRAVHCNSGRPELWVMLPGD